MNIVQREKRIDPHALNIGVELEALIVERDTLQTISRATSEAIFQTLLAQHGWKIRKQVDAEIHAIEKIIAGHLVELKLDMCFALFEFATPSPFASLAEMEHVHQRFLQELRDVCVTHGAMIWPCGVAPGATNLFNLPKPRVEFISDHFDKPFRPIEDCERYGFIAAHQVNIDVPLAKMMTTINALYKHLGEYIERFANGPTLVNGKLYREGRYYYWNEYRRDCDIADFHQGHLPLFPPEEFPTLDAFYSWIWSGEFAMVYRDGWLWRFSEATTSIHDYIRAGQGEIITVGHQKRIVTLEAQDIPIFFITMALDFKPHYDFFDFTLDDFLGFYRTHDIDGFLRRFVKHAWLEIRCCSPHFEEHAMVLPRFFYHSMRDLEAFIATSRTISWEEARKRRDAALFFIP